MWLLFCYAEIWLFCRLKCTLCKQMCKQFYHANYFCRSNLLQSSSTSWQHLSINASSDTAQEAKVHFPRCFRSGKGLGLQEKPAEEIMSRQRSHCQTHKRQSIIMRTRTVTERSFICLTLGIATAGRRRKIRLLIYKVWIPDKVEILLDTPAAIKYTCSDSRKIWNGFGSLIICV